MKFYKINNIGESFTQWIDLDAVAQVIHVPTDGKGQILSLMIPNLRGFSVRNPDDIKNIASYLEIILPTT